MFCFHFTGFPYFTFASSRLRNFLFLSENQVEFNPSLSVCEQNGSSIVTLYDQDDASFTNLLTGNTHTGTWLGLIKREENVSWSDGVPTIYISKMRHVNVAQGEQICGAIENNTLTGFNCSERKHFMCYKGKFQHFRIYFDGAFSQIHLRQRILILNNVFM